MTGSAGENAVGLFGRGYNCAEAVFKAVCEAKGLSCSSAEAVVFGGGVARQGWVCGALTGGLMALAAEANAVCPEEDKPARLEVMKKAVALAGWFEEKAGSQLCRELTGVVLSEPGAYEKLRAQGIKEKVCNGLVRDTAEYVVGSTCGSCCK